MKLENLIWRFPFSSPVLKSIRNNDNLLIDEWFPFFCYFEITDKLSTSPKKEDHATSFQVKLKFTSSVSLCQIIVQGGNARHSAITHTDRLYQICEIYNASPL